MSDNSQYSISVVIPTYNRRDFLAGCLESVFRQTALPDEIIVVDDGSTDGTSEWIAQTYPDIHLISQPNAGVSAARNAGIRLAKSNWIALLDSDDVWLPEKIGLQVAALKAEPSYKICHTEEKWIFDGMERPVAPAYRKRGGRIFEACLPVCAISPSTVLIHRSLFDEIGLFDESFPVCEDYDLWLRIAARHPVLLIDAPLIEKRGGHGDQLSSQRGLDRYRIKALSKILDQESLNSEYRKAAIEMLKSKCSIFAQGAEKRGRMDEADHYRSLPSRFAN